MTGASGRALRLGIFMPLAMVVAAVTAADGNQVFTAINACLQQHDTLALDQLPPSTIAAARRDAVGRTPLTYLIEMLDGQADAQSQSIAVAIAERLLAGGCDVNLSSTHGDRPLHLAAGTGQTALVTLLLAHAVEIEATDAKGCTALMAAVQARWPNPEVVTALLAHHAATDTHLTERVPMTPLAIAISCRLTALDDLRQGAPAVFDGPDPAHRAQDAFAIITALLSAHAHADIQVVGPTGFAWPALHAALRTADLMTAQALLDHGVEPLGTVDAGLGVMRCAIDSGHADAVRFLTRLGIGRAELDAQGNSVAFSAGNAEVLGALLSAGLSPDTRRTDRVSLLHAAAEADQAEWIKVLADHGASIDLTLEPGRPLPTGQKHANERWIIGRTPLWTALASHRPHALVALLARGATVTLRQVDGTTALHLAARWSGALLTDDDPAAPPNHLADASALIRLLVAEGADPNAVTTTSSDRTSAIHRSPLHDACQAHAYDAAETLLDLGADAHLADSHGCEAWRLALTDSARRALWVGLFAHHGIVIAGQDIHRLDLQDAVEQDDRALAEHLLSTEPALAALATPPGCRVDNAPILQVAIAHHDAALVTLLIAHGADPLAVDARGRSSLHRAIETNQPELMPILLAHGAQIDELSTSDPATVVTPLALALGRNPNGQPLRDTVQQLSLVHALLDAGADVNAAIGPDHCALEIACANGQAAAAKLLLEHGARCDFHDSTGRTLLHQLAWGSKQGLEIAELLLAQHLDVNCADTARHETPLHKIARSSRTDAIRLLVAHGALVDARDIRNRTPLELAAESGNVIGIEALLEAGAAVDASDADGITPLIIAIESAQVDSVAHLLAHHAASAQTALPAMRGWVHLKQGQHYKLQALLTQDPAVATTRLILGQTLLMRAADRGDALSVRLLLEHGADPNAADDQGRTAVMHAVLATGLDRASLLSNLFHAGADATHADLNGKTAISLVPVKVTGDVRQDRVNAEVASLLHDHLSGSLRTTP